MNCAFLRGITGILPLINTWVPGVQLPTFPPTCVVLAHRISPACIGVEESQHMFRVIIISQ